MGSTGLTDRPIEASWESSPGRLWDRPWPRFSTAGAAMTKWTAPLILARRVLPPPRPTVTMPPGRNWAHSASLLKKLHYPSEISRSGCLHCRISWSQSQKSRSLEILGDVWAKIPPNLIIGVPLIIVYGKTNPIKVRIIVLVNYICKKFSGLKKTKGLTIRNYLDYFDDKNQLIYCVWSNAFKNCIQILNCSGIITFFKSRYNRSILRWDKIF